ncbi:hypothetical protein CDL15_Pgr008176 [Punica granatum]|uniref:TIR domain-containing protein n=1 Tax=Punica granatum TaxID=22663 RepID=A0A218VTH2_PUNGR|nr:hypothetical protein CDL15_Pgr008176 [Punica granatum]
MAPGKRGPAFDSMAERSSMKKRRANDNPCSRESYHQDTDGSYTNTLSSSFSLAGAEQAHEFDGFLNFRGADNRKTFSDYLYHSLKDAGVRVFRDSEELHVGEEIDRRLMEVIVQSKICMPIFSKGYAWSKWCLKEVAEMMKCMTVEANKHLIMPVFLDVTPEEVQHQTGCFADAFSLYEEQYDPETVQGWRDALKGIVKLKGLELVKVANGDIWESTIEQLRMEPNMKVKEKLKISYDSLDHKQKEIFLDIACFFTGTDVRDVIPTWDDCKFFPAVGIEILQLKSLIKILDGNKIWMHDQLIDLGRHIVDQENYKEPELRSRLWRSKEAIKVLADQQGTSKVEAMAIFQEESRFIVKGDCLRSEHFKKLSKLSWIDEDWNGWSSLKMVKLKVLKLSYCPELRRIPDFSAFPNLERLMLYFCLNLVSVDPSIGLLKALNILDMRKCQSLRKLPKQLGSLEALTELIIDGTFIQEIPISTGMKKLEFLSANQCKNLNRIPESVGSLMKLKRLSLEGCCGLKELPDSIGQLNSLVELRLGNSGITSLPRSLGTLEKLELLDTSCCSSQEGEIPTEVEMVARISRCARLGFGRVKILPEGISSLSRRRTHYRKGRLQTLPELPSSLISLKVEGSTRLAFPDLSALINLKELYLCGDFKLSGECLAKLFKLEKLVLKSSLNAFRCKAIESIPDLSRLQRLKNLILEGCDNLRGLNGLGELGLLELLNMNGCKAIEKLPNLSRLQRLRVLRMEGCDKLRRLGGLQELKSLQILDISGCKAIEVLPTLSKLQMLRELRMEACEKLLRLEGLEELESLNVLDISGCRAIEKLPDLSKLQLLRSLSMGDCENIREVLGLDELSDLEVLWISGCRALKLPDLSKLLRVLTIE